VSWKFVTILKGWTSSLETTDLEDSKTFQGLISCPAVPPNEENFIKLACSNSWLISSYV